MNSTKRAAIYLRVSTAEQTTANQLRELEAVAASRGWTLIKIYEDHGISGAKGREARPAFDQLCKDAARRRFDVVMVWSVDRLGRNLHHLSSFMESMTTLGVDLYLHQQAVDTSTPAGKAMLSMCGVFSEFERGMIVERIRAGLARARAQGKRLGRPPVDRSIQETILRERATGKGILKIGRELGLGTSTVQRVIAQSIAVTDQ